MSDLPALAVLEEQERAFVREVARGATPAEACRLAGYDERQAWDVFRRPRVLVAVHQAVAQALQADAPLSLKVLKTLRDDTSTPARTRADIGLKLLAMAGHGQQSATSDDSKPLSDMAPAELLAFIDRNQAEIDRLEAELAARAKDVSAPIKQHDAAKPQSFLD